MNVSALAYPQALRLSCIIPKNVLDGVYVTKVDDSSTLLFWSSTPLHISSFLLTQCSSCSWGIVSVQYIIYVYAIIA